MHGYAVIETADLCKSYRTDGGEVRAVRGVHLRIERGELVAVMGPSGSGKSTLMNLLGLLDRPDSGRYLLAGQDVTALDADAAAALRNEALGFVFQNYNLLARLTAAENVEMPLTYAGIGRAERRRRALAALEAVGLGHRAEHWPSQLSGGEQQRVAIARALVIDPLIVLADEPTGSVDTKTGNDVLELFAELNAAGRTIVVVTHDERVAARAPRVVSMLDGRISADRSAASAPPAAAIASPAAPSQGRVLTASPTARSVRGAVLRGVESVAVAVRSLRANLLRSALTTLGVIVGVGAVITMVAIGEGANLRIADQMRSLGTNLLLVQPGSAGAGAVRLGAGTAVSLTEDDAAAIESEIPGVLVAAPGVSGSAQLVRANRNWGALIGGVTPAYMIAREWQVGRGRSFNAEEAAMGAKLVLLGAATAAELFGSDDPLEQTVRIGNVPFTVIGVLQEKGHNSDSGRNQDDVALLPLSTAKLRLFGRYSQLDRLSVDYILVKLSDGASMRSAAGEIAALLRHRHRLAERAENDFTITDPTAAIQSQAGAARALSLLLSGVSAVSLVVGGIGIMNIMLVSVTERTREIGIRLAVGARRRDLWSQFIVEALVLCLLGGGLGIVLGAAVSVGIAAVAGWPVFLGPGVIVLAVGSACAVGLFFGFYPSLKASRMHPIAALRYE
jgi:macrolide transport system ATP-binding/permease protein